MFARLERIVVSVETGSEVKIAFIIARKEIM